MQYQQSKKHEFKPHPDLVFFLPFPFFNYFIFSSFLFFFFLYYLLNDNWRASETLSGVYKFELVRYVYIYIYVWRYVFHNSSACHVYVMWAELGHSHFLYICASRFKCSNQWKRHGHKKCFKRNRALWFEFSIHFSVFAALLL